MARIPYRMLATLSILITLIFSTPTKAAVPPNRNTTTIITTPPSLSIAKNINYTPPTHKCIKPGLFKSDKRPSWPECYRAIRTLPHLHGSGTFHNFGTNNGYRLPVTERFGRCRAQVELRDRASAQSSWTDVVAALDQLSILCRRMTRQEERVAGWMVMGPEERIKVSLLGPDDPIVGSEGGGVGGWGVFLNGTEGDVSE